MVIVFSQDEKRNGRSITESIIKVFIAEVIRLKFKIETYTWKDGQQGNLSCFRLFGIRIGSQINKIRVVAGV